LLIRDDDPIWSGADVATDEFKLRSITSPHELPRLADHRFVDRLDKLCVLAAGEEPGEALS
jgi:hypothetical protein